LGSRLLASLTPVAALEKVHSDQAAGLLVGWLDIPEHKPESKHLKVERVDEGASLFDLVTDFKPNSMVHSADKASGHLFELGIFLGPLFQLGGKAGVGLASPFDNVPSEFGNVHTISPCVMGKFPPWHVDVFPG
jgi:hypothetical protein